MSTIHLTTEYVAVYCGKDGCNQHFAMSEAFYRQTRRTRETWYCPSGHPRIWLGESDESKLRRAQARETALKDQLAAATREAEEVRVALLRDRQRFAKGVCPCCNRSFDNVRRHMETKHPDYDTTRIHNARRVEYKCSCGYVGATLHGLRVHQGKSRREGWDEPGTSRWSSHLTAVAR
jgi:hypothetical protein